jgi:hypothetical protein
MVHKINVQIKTAFLFRDKDTQALQTGKTLSYSVYNPTNILHANGSMAEIGNTAIYTCSWTPNAAGWWIVSVSCANPVMNDLIVYFVSSGIEKDIASKFI